MRTIKKYANRRLYDTQESRYITLEDVRLLVCQGVDFQVLDAKTTADLTQSVLLQIIAEYESNSSQALLSQPLLQHLIRAYGQSFHGLLGSYLEQAMTVFLTQQDASGQQSLPATRMTPFSWVTEMLKLQQQRLKELQAK